jgi:hypothetical protein
LRTAANWLCLPRKANQGSRRLWCEIQSLTPQTQNSAPPGAMSGSLLETCRSSSTPSQHILSKGAYGADGLPCARAPAVDPEKKGVLVDRARAETLVFRLARQERDTWVTWPTRVAALMAAQLSAEMEKVSGTPVTIETAILQRVLETHVREQLDALADLKVSLE